MAVKYLQVWKQQKIVGELPAYLDPFLMLGRLPNVGMGSAKIAVASESRCRFKKRYLARESI